MDLTWIIVHVVVPLVVVGLGLWVLNELPWIDAGMKKIIRIVIIVCVVLWLLLGVLVPLLDSSGPVYYRHR